MSLTRLLSPVLAVAFAAAFSAAQGATNTASQKHLLRIAPSVGTANLYQQSTQMTMSMAMEGSEKPMEMEQSSSIWIEAKAVESKEGKTKLEQTFQRVKVKMTGVANVDYDSNDPESRPGPMEALAETVGEKATVVMDARGSILSVELPEALDEAQAAGSGVDFKQMFSQSTPQLPEESVAIGHEWTTEMPMPMGQMGKLKCTITNKLVSVEKGLARIDQKLAFATDELKLPGGMEMSVGEASGFTVVDLSTGLAHDSSNSVTMVMSGGPTNMKMTMKMVQAMKRVDPATEASAEKAKAAEKTPEPAKSGK
jgi:Family of unknown function (DUF6263)